MSEVSDEQIRELRWHALWDKELANRRVVALCDAALRPGQGVRAEIYRSARLRCAELLAARKRER